MEILTSSSEDVPASRRIGAVPRPSYFRGLVAVAIDLTALVGFLVLATSLETWWLQLGCGVLAGLAIGCLFVAGHDAAHDSLTPSRRLNRVLGRIAFLPALTSFSLWVHAHNIRHHRWTNFAPRDMVWTPLDIQQYRALSRPGRLLYRFYRSVWGPLGYFSLELWLKHLLFPFRSSVGRQQRRYVLDSALVVAFALGYVALLLVTHQARGSTAPWWNPLLFGVVVPFFVWNIAMGLVIYLHHTHPDVAWYSNEARYRREAVQAELTVEVAFPKAVHHAFHSIMSHGAHHIRSGIPFYHLDEAQARLARDPSLRFPRVEWTLRVHLDIVRRCKLYDFESRKWTDFEGNVTS